MIASLSARRAWIEIYHRDKTPALRVALRKESVDRNCDSDPVTDKAWAVALRKESVDRNHFCAGAVNSKCRVALRKESMECFSF